MPQFGTADDGGNIITGSPIDAAESVSDARMSDFILYGVFNGAFARGPVGGVGSAIDDQNQMPDWTGPVQVSGGAITASWVADASSPSGYNLRFSIAAGAAGDEAYLEQVVPVGGSRGRSFGNIIRGWFYRVTASGGVPLGVIAAQYLKADGSTTGSELSATTSLSANSTLYYLNRTASTVGPPADALYLRIRVGVRRNTMAATDTATIDFSDVRVDRGGAYLLAAETADPSTYGAGIIDVKSAGSLYFRPNNSLTTYVQADDGTGYISLYANSTIELKPGGSGVLAASSTATLFTIVTPAVFSGGCRGTVIRPAIAGTVDNWNPTGLVPGVVIIADLGGANRTITGIAAQADGAFVYLMAQSSTNTITLSHLSASSSAANQFRLPAGVDYTVGNKAGVTLVYDATDTKWRVVGPA